jgi:hypothetical protein
VDPIHDTLFARKAKGHSPLPGKKHEGRKKGQSTPMSSQHLNHCQRCRITHRHVAAAIQAWRAHRDFEAVLKLYAAADRLVSQEGCMRAQILILEAARDLQVTIDWAQRPLPMRF